MDALAYQLCLQYNIVSNKNDFEEFMNRGGPGGGPGPYGRDIYSLVFKTPNQKTTTAPTRNSTESYYNCKPEVPHRPKHYYFYSTSNKIILLLLRKRYVASLSVYPPPLPPRTASLPTLTIRRAVSELPVRPPPMVNYINPLQV